MARLFFSNLSVSLITQETQGHDKRKASQVLKEVLGHQALVEHLVFYAACTTIQQFGILFWVLSRAGGTRTVGLVLHCQQCKLCITTNKRRLDNCATLNGNLLYTHCGPVPDQHSLALQ